MILNEQQLVANLRETADGWPGGSTSAMCRRAADRIEELERELSEYKRECKRLDDGLNRACDRITDLQRQPGMAQGPTMRFATRCPDGQLCGTSATTGCLEGQCQRDMGKGADDAIKALLAEIKTDA